MHEAPDACVLVGLSGGAAAWSSWPAPPPPPPPPIHACSKRARISVKTDSRADKSKGLRHFSLQVCRKVQEKQRTTYNEVADELVDEYFRTGEGQDTVRKVRGWG